MNGRQIIELPRGHRNQQAGCRRHHVEAQEAHRWRRIEQDHVEILGHAGDADAQRLQTLPHRLPAFAQGRGQIPFGILQAQARWYDLDRRPGGVADGLRKFAEGAARRQERAQSLFVIDQRFRLNVEHGRRRCLRIAIDHQHAIAMQGEIIGEMLGDRAFADSAFEILHCQHHGILVGLLADMNAQRLADMGQVFERVVAAAIGLLLGLGQTPFGLRLGQRFGRPADQFSGNGRAKTDIERLVIVRPKHDRLDMIAHLLAGGGDVPQCVDRKRHDAPQRRITTVENGWRLMPPFSHQSQTVADDRRELPLTAQ